MMQIRIGQVLLIICCVFYLVWWCVAFHPAHGDNHTSGVDGILLIVTALFGLGGVAINLIGIRDSGADTGFISGGMIAVIAIIVYVVLLFGTRIFFHRQVTTELLLIVGWAALMVSSINTVYALEQITMDKVIVMLAIIGVAAALSFVFYMLYYNVPPMRGYVYGMIPLITEAVSMAAFLAAIGR